MRGKPLNRNGQFELFTAVCYKKLEKSMIGTLRLRSYSDPPSKSISRLLEIN
jgi:hypothetical protein